MTGARWPFDGPAIDGPASGQRLAATGPDYYHVTPPTLLGRLLRHPETVAHYRFAGGRWTADRPAPPTVTSAVASPCAIGRGLDPDTHRQPRKARPMTTRQIQTPPADPDFEQQFSGDAPGKPPRDQIGNALEIARRLKIAADALNDEIASATRNGIKVEIAITALRTYESETPRLDVSASIPLW